VVVVVVVVVVTNRCGGYAFVLVCGPTQVYSK